MVCPLVHDLFQVELFILILDNGGLLLTLLEHLTHSHEHYVDEMKVCLQHQS